MAIKSIDLQSVEHGIGLGRVETIVGDPFASTVVRDSVPVAETLKGNADGFDISSATALRLYYDLVKGAATFVDIIIKVRASDPGSEGIPKPKGTGDGAADFLPRLPQFDDAIPALVPIGTKVRLTVDERGCVTIPRLGQAFKIFIQSDNAAAALALAVQSVLAGSE